MEGEAFSPARLAPEVLAEEEKIWTLSIENTREALEKNVESLYLTEVAFIKALFGRDVIGAYNTKVMKSMF